MVNNDLFDSYLMSQYVKECGFNQPQDFDKAPLRILFHFPGNMAAKVVSATHFCLYNCVKQTFPDVFVDICFEPFEWARNTYYKTHKPMVGFFSKRSWEDFDMIGLSNAISMSDYADTYRNLVNAGFPLKRAQRDDKVAPFIWAGGIANDGAEAFNSIVDMCCEGLGERSIPKLVEFALDHDPKLPQNRELIRKTFQGKYGYYDPSIYKYTWDIVDGHVESHWDNPELGMIIPEVSLPIDKYGKTDDTKYKDTTPGGQGKVSLLSSWGCSSAKGTCNFCHEARLYGSFRERDMVDLEQGLHDAKASSMGEAFSYFSFNSNFHSHYPESLALAYDYFDRLSILNMRVDALAASIRNDPVNNYVRLIKELGANSMSCPSEGWGERLRNHFLNKNLTHDDLMLVAKEAFKQHFARLKIGYIRTYYETDQDWKDGFDELFEICRMRDEMGVNCKIQATCTSLIHNYGTPLYFKPRASAYAEWLKEFNSDKFYEYPYMPLVDQGIKVNLNGGKDTFVQQLMQDLPHELVEDILLKPALTTRTLSGDYVKLVKEGLERHGIDPRKQFLKFDPHKNPHQHIEVNPCQDGYDQPDFCEKAVTMCLKTPATVIHGQVTKCDGCGACQRIDKTREEEGLDKRSHVKWMLTRELNTKYDIMDIKTAKLKNRPNYQYEFIFKVNEKGYFISKEHLARRWMVQLAKFDDSIVKSFRSFKGSFYTYADYPGLPSVIDGYMVCYPSFKDKLPDNYQELINKANAECEAIQCIGVHEHLEAGYPNYLYLYKIDLKVSALETKEFVEAIKANPFRVYEDNTSDYTEFETNFWIKQVGSSILILAPGRMNAAYSLLTKCTFNKLMNKVLKHQTVIGIFSRVSDVELVNIITGKPQAVAGFDFVSKGSFADREVEEDGLVAEGA